jgi:arsenite/tail-anchored protein-transporting ATPase
MTLARVLFVTGKGGTGKSTVAAALAIALARRRPTILADLDGRGAAAAMFGAQLGGAEPVAVSPTLSLVALSREGELESFIERIVPVRAISRRMLRSRTFAYVTAALPGLEAFLLLERLRIMGGDAALEDRHLVVDAPASGSALELLSVPSGLKGVAPGGLLNRLAQSVGIFLADPSRFATILTVMPEELAIREALETAVAIRDRLGIATAAAIMNRTPSPLFELADLESLKPLSEHAELAARRVASYGRSAIGAARLREAGVATITLPMLFTPAMGRDQLAELGHALEAELLDR